MSGETWIFIGAVCATIGVVAIPYGFYLKSITQSQKKIEIKQETSGEQSPNIVSKTPISEGSINQKAVAHGLPTLSLEGKIQKWFMRLCIQIRQTLTQKKRSNNG
jgi:hypothetical protein